MNRPPKILIVEHEHGAARQIRDTLVSLGFAQTQFALAAQEALGIVQAGGADIVLIDVKLPGDVDLADQIASQYHLPVLYLTATADPAFMEHVNAGNLFGYLVKPVEVRELHAVLDLAVESWRERQDSRPPVSTHGESAAMSLARLESILDGIGEPLFSIDGDWRVTYANDHALIHFGHPRERIVGRTLWELVPAGVRDKQHHEFYKALTRHQTRMFEYHDEPKSQWFDVRAYPFREGLLVFLRDVTERRTALEQASRLDKLEGLGLLARGFAHDFNNLLTVLLGNLSLASVKDPREGDYEEALSAARQATLQAQNLVQQLLTFAKGGVPIKEPLELNAQVREVIESRLRRAHVEYRLVLTEPVTAEVDKSQFRRLLENLIQNSEQALLTGGVVTVSTGMYDRANPPTTRLPNLDPNTRYMVVQVADNGEGIPATNLEKIFEPYYSTRSDANASGIGLTVCDSIARAHQGFLSVESRFGSYTKVCLFLPATLRKRDLAPGPPRQTRPLANRVPKRVLVLEDDRCIRTLIAMALKKNGYVVHETEEGSQTVAAYRQAWEAGVPFDLVITDLSIPNGMSGVEAIEQIRQLDPDVTAVVSSGYSDDPVMANFQEYGFAGVLPKPYEPSALGRLVREILEAAPVVQRQPSLT